MNNINRSAELSSKFDWEIYIQCNPALNLNTYEAAHEHWVKIGRARGLVATEEQFYVVYGFDRSDLPNDFDWQEYLACNPDVEKRMGSKWQAIRHFLKYGRLENRQYSVEHKGDVFFKDKQWQQAIEVYRQAIDFQPQSIQLRLKLVEALIEAEEVDQAEQQLQEAISTLSTMKQVDVEVLLKRIQKLRFNYRVTDATKKDTLNLKQVEENRPEVTSADIEFDPTSYPEKPAFIEGCLDRVTQSFVSGWARDKNNPHRVISVDVFVGNSLIGNCTATRLRQDLAKKFGDHGCYGFHMELPSALSLDQEVMVSVRLTESGKDLAKSPVRFRFGAKGTSSSKPFSNYTARSIRSLLYRPPVRHKLDSSHTGFPSIAIIILNLDGAKLLDELFQSFIDYNSYPQVELIIVDHGSNDASAEVCQCWQEILPIKLLKRNHNFSFSNSNNLAAQQTHAELLFFLNNDITFCQDILPQMVVLMQDSRIGALGIKLLDIIEHDYSLALPPIQHLGVQFDFHDPTRLFRPFDIKYSPEFLDVQSSPWQVPCVTGAALMCRREDFFAIGGFNDNYFYGCEDIDFCLSMRQLLGKEIICSNNFLAYHHRGFTRFNQAPVLKQNLLDNRRILAERFGYAVRRSHLRDFFEKPRYWTSHSLRVGFAVTEAKLSAAAGDYFTALELGEHLAKEFGWEIHYLSKGNDWYDMTMLDVLIVMRDDYDLRQLKNAKPSLLKVMWARNWFDRLASREWIGKYHCIWASSKTAANYLSQKLSKVVSIIRIATNPERFTSVDFDLLYASDYCFTGSYWNAHREIMDCLVPEKLPYTFALYGHNWENCNTLAPYHRGSLSYNDMPKVYASTKIVVDDANSVTKEWGSVNSRVFDALGAGALVITNGVKGGEEVFNGLLPTYDSAESLQNLLHEYLSNESKRLLLVQQLQKIVQEHHTYQERAHTVFTVLREKLCETFRIAIKIGVPRWEVAEEWGDYHYALAMKRAFERQNHSVRIDILPEWETDFAYGDDVVIVLRGLSSYQPKPYHINLMWNISHPDKISIYEYEQYDHIFVASNSYAQKLSCELRVPVQPLLQCTDPELFYPDFDLKEEVGAVIFVGNSRKVYRKIVRDAVAANLAVDVYGTNWENFLSNGYIKGKYIPNQFLRRYYSNCKVLLNDHWDNMRENGFISNRLFDAVACGATVVSDYVPGLEDIFGNKVISYETAEELKSIVEFFLGQPRQNLEQRLEFAEFIRITHSFDRRIENMLEVIQSLNKAKLERL